MDDITQVRYKLAKCIQVTTAKIDLQPLVYEILKKSSCLRERYYSLESEKLLKENVEGHNIAAGISALINALKILEKYGKNLLRSNKPPQWRVVRWSNPVFRQQVNSIKGSRDVLKLLGYTEAVNDGASFPPTVDHPDQEIVSFATSDIILLKYELVWYQKQQHPSPNTVTHCFNYVNVSKETFTFHTEINEQSSSNVSEHKSLSASLMEDLCAVCGQKLADFFCPICKMKQCTTCDQKWHLNRSRAEHQRERINSLSKHNHSIQTKEQQSISTVSNVLKTPSTPVLPGQAFNSPEVPSSDENCPFLFDKTSLVNYSSAKPVAKSHHHSSETTSIDWDEKFQEIEVQLFTIADVDQQHKLLESFCKDVDEQVKIYCEKAEGVHNLPYVKRHFLERSDSLSKQKIKLIDKFFSNTQGSLLFFEGNPQDRILRDDTTTTSNAFQINESSIRIEQSAFNPISRIENVERSENIFHGSACFPQVNILQPSNRSENKSSFFPENVTLPYRSGLGQNNPISDKMPMPNNIQSTTRVTPQELKEYNAPIIPISVPGHHAVFPDQNISEKIDKENLRASSLKTINKIRNANIQGMAPEEILVAIEEPKKSQDSLTSFSSNDWKKLILESIEECPSVSYIEACRLYILFERDIEVTKRSIKSQHLCRMKLFSQPDLYSDLELENSLRVHQGDFDKALIEVQKPHMQTFLNRLQKSSTNSVSRLTVKHLLEISDRSHLKNIVIAIFSVKDVIVADMMCSILFQDFEFSEKTRELSQVLKDYNLQDIYEAAKSFPDDFDLAIKYLSNKCNLCLEMFPQNRVECMTACGDKGCSYCQECLAKYLELTINEGHIRDLVCPVCKLPDIDSDEEAAINHFSYLDAVIKKHLTEHAHSVYQKKLTDQTLMKMPNFRWCSHCENGFVYEQQSNNLKMKCPACNKATCYNCKKRWETQHEGISCQKFLEWKQLNDEDFQAAGLAAHLKENGIDCPSCNFRYALAKGGCMHFKCIMCSFQFCSGCKNPFKQGQVCNILTDCFKRGLHAHHPRDCLFYMRDLEIERLQQILSNAQIPFGTESKHRNKFCQVLEQKETSECMVDAECGREVLENNADLCELHYKEYLVNLINDYRLDPADVFTTAELETCLNRSEFDYNSDTLSKSDEENKTLLLGFVKLMPLIHQKKVIIVDGTHAQTSVFQDLDNIS